MKPKISCLIQKDCLRKVLISLFIIDILLKYSSWNFVRKKKNVWICNNHCYYGFHNLSEEYFLCLQIVCHSQLLIVLCIDFTTACVLSEKKKKKYIACLLFLAKFNEVVLIRLISNILQLLEYLKICFTYSDISFTSLHL